MADSINSDTEPPDLPESVELPITGELDLHTFRPQDVRSLLPDYFAECRRRGIQRVRVVHGKGSGQLRQTVLSIIARLPDVAGHEPAGELEGSWGATIVWLKN